MIYLQLLVFLSIVATVLVNADSIERVGRDGAGGFSLRYTKVYYPYPVLTSPLFRDIGPRQQQIQQDKNVNFVEILAMLFILFQASRIVLNQSGGVEGGEGAATTTATSTTTTATTTTATTTMTTTTEPCIDDPRLNCDIEACGTDLATFCKVTCNLCP